MSFDRHSCFTDLTQRSAPERRSASLRNRCSPSPEYPRSPSTAVKPTGCCRLKSQVAPVATRRKARSLPSISEQYMKFEFTSLRQTVSTAEKSSYVAPEIWGKGRLFAVFPQQTGPEKMAAELRHSRCSGFSPGPPLVVRFQEPARANA